MIQHMAYVSPSRFGLPGRHNAPADCIDTCPCVGCDKIILRGQYARGFLDAARVGRGYRWLAVALAVRGWA